MIKFEPRLYKYDSSQENNNYRGEDFSRYIATGYDVSDNLDDTLDLSNITLFGLPFREEFAPETKFILEIWEKRTNALGEQEEYLDENQVYHLCVDTDAVNPPVISNQEYFDHHISFIEPAVVAQKRLVDNIAVTYKLKDINLEVEPTYDRDAIAPMTRTDTSGEQISYPTDNFNETSGFVNWRTRIIGHQFRWVMPDWYQVTLNGVTKTPSWQDWEEFKLYQEIAQGESDKLIELPVPMLECLSSVAGGKTFRHNGYCSVNVEVVETSITDPNDTQTVMTMQTNPSAQLSQESWTPDAMLPELSGFGWIESRPFAVSGGGEGLGPLNTAAILHKRTQVAVQDATTQNRVISFRARFGYTYKIIVTRAILNPRSTESSNYNPTPDFTNYADKYDEIPYYWGSGNYTSYVLFFKTSNNGQQLSTTFPQITINFNAVIDGANYSIYTRSAQTATALKLYNKAQLTTQDMKKVDGIPVDDTPASFYLEDNDKQELDNTIIVENFYNEKNLWEIQMDIGKYIHARPKIRFGKNNRFVTNWKRYGLTTQYEDNAYPISIYNSRFVEEYISALSSYVSNMIQMGGIITEYIAPKSSSDDYLVYNDVAELITNKNIIEIVNLDVIRKSDGLTRNLTGKPYATESENGYVFEESVYNLLPIYWTANINKGKAIYYQLGTNKIVGLNYQLPVVNTGDETGDYAIKNIIAEVYGYNDTQRANVKVNDYLFKITYRTKDTLRTDQTRPDLRKYLLSTPYDNVPQHNQFNNQQDTVVDSVKFGNNIYGKLIRTGNTTFTKNEWVDTIQNLKHSGELYKIDGNLYYVAKVKNIFFPDHIVSQIEFSKDFNRLSQIIGIPSEPRFYEISERSQIRREKPINDYIVLSTEENENGNDNCYVKQKGWEYIAQLLLDEDVIFPKYAVTMFKSDIDKEQVAGNETFLVETCHPLSCYSIENTLTLEWDMLDNFSAGDQVQVTEQHLPDHSTIDTAYNVLMPYRYADVHGRADMFDFAIIKDYTFTNQNVIDLPKNPIVIEDNQNNLLFGNEEIADYGSHKKGNILLKDNREAISFNYNLQMLTDSDRFVLSAYMWQQEKSNLKLGLLKEEINKISNDTIPNTSFAVGEIPFTYSVDNGLITIDILNSLTDYAETQGITLEELMNGISAIVLYSTNEVNDITSSGAKYFVFGRNISDLDLYDKTKDWKIRNVNKSNFQQQ